MNSNINNSIFEAYVKSKTPIVENKQENQQVVEEASNSKPDYLDLDKDGNKKESMKKAASDAKKGMSDKQAKFFGKKSKKSKKNNTVKEDVNLNADQKVLRENFRAILQKNGLADLVTPKIIKAMLEAFALGKSVNESSDEKAKLQAEYNALKNTIANMSDEHRGHDNSRLLKRLKEIKDKLKGMTGYTSKGD